MSLSFKIERPSGSSNGRHHHHHQHHHARGEKTFAADYGADSSEDEAEEERRRNHREVITDFDSSRPVARKEELSIAPLPDKDFRAIHLAKKRKKEMYRPEGGAVGVMRQADARPGVKADEGAEGVDQMNARPVEGGLKVGAVVKKEDEGDGLEVPSALVPGTGASTPIGQLSLSGPNTGGAPSPSASGLAPPKKEDETEDQKALRELLAGEGKLEEAQIDVIQMAKQPDSDSDDGYSSSGVQDESSVFRRDVASRPDMASLEDYARVPVGQFGAALLRGMGWKEGQAASKNGREGPVEAYVPKARPSLLGIGAKPMQVDEGTGGKDKKQARPERRYVPLVRKVTDRNAQSGADDSDAYPPSRSRSRSPPSRRSSRSPPRSSSRRDRYDSDREGYGSSSSRRYDSDRDRDRERAKDRDRERDRDKERRRRDERDRGERHYDKDRPREGEKDRYGDSRGSTKDRRY